MIYRRVDGFFRAKPWHRTALARLAYSSKAYWGYERHFLQQCLADLYVPWTALVSGQVLVHHQGRRWTGFFALEGAGRYLELTHLFVHPRCMGRGIGRQLWKRALRDARRRGAFGIEVHSDPHAAGFYESMGAVCVGAARSRIGQGRKLPTYRAAWELDFREEAPDVPDLSHG